MGYSDDRSPNKSSDDSFEADCYKHVEKKLEIQLPKCLSKENKINLTNHFLNKKSTKEQNKRVIRRRLSAYQIKAAVLYNTEKSNNNSNYNNNVPTGKDNKYEKYSESGDRSSGDREKQQSTYVLQAKVQHLLFEMVRQNLAENWPIWIACYINRRDLFIHDYYKIHTVVTHNNSLTGDMHSHLKYQSTIALAVVGIKCFVYNKNNAESNVS